jgi:hypothetical protein
MIHDDEAALLKTVERELKDVAERHRSDLIAKIQQTSRSLNRFRIISMTRTWKDADGCRVHVETNRLWLELQQLCNEFQNLYNLQFGHLSTMHSAGK